MLEVLPTRDLEAVKRVLTHPAVYGMMADDFAPEPEDLTIPDDPRVKYWLARDNASDLGIFLVIERSPVRCEVHFCFLPRSWGKKGLAREASAVFLHQLWMTTTYQRAIGNIPAWNRLALKFAKQFGFRSFGRDRCCVQKNGRLCDEIWVGISRPPQ